MAYGSASYLASKSKNNNDLTHVTSSNAGQKNRGDILGGIGYVGGSFAAGVGSIAEGIIDLGVAGVSSLFGDTETAENAFKNNVVGDWHEDLTEDYNPGGMMQFIGDVSHGLGQSSWYLLSLIPGAQWVGPVVTTAGYIGQGISSGAEITGDVGLKEVAYGTTTGLAEGALDVALGAGYKGAKTLGKSVFKTGTKEAAKTAAKEVARKGVVKTVLSDAAGEFAEEFLSEYLDTFLQRTYQVDPNAQYSLKNALYAGAVGFVSGSVSSGGSNITSAAVNQRRGAKIVKNGNEQTLINTATYVADKLAGSGTNYKNTAEWINILRGDVDAYNKLNDEQKKGMRGQTILGEMQAALYFAEMQTVFGGVQDRIQNADEHKRAVWAEQINKTVDKDKRKKDYTAADIAKNTDNIAWQLAVMQFVGEAYDIDGAAAAMQTEEGIQEKIAEYQSSQSKTQSVSENNVSVDKHEIKKDSTGNVYVDVDSNVVSTGDSPKQIAQVLSNIVSTKFSDYIDVKGQKIGINQRTAREWIRSKSAEALKKQDVQKYIDKANAFGNADELLKISKDYIGEATKHSRNDNFVEFARGIVNYKVGENGYIADIVVGITNSGEARLYDIVRVKNKKIVADTSYATQDRRYDTSATQDTADQNSGTSKKSIPQKEPSVNPQDKKNTDQKDIASKEQSKSKSPTVKKPKESLTDKQRVERAKIESERIMRFAKESEPTVKELNTLREYVKGFDNLEINRRMAIVRMLRTAEGVDSKIVKGVANLMAMTTRSGKSVAPDLEFRFAKGISDRGVYTHVGDKTVVLINSNTDFSKTIRGTIAHELVHYIENRTGYKDLADYVMKTAKQEKKDAIRKEYEEHYKEAYVNGYMKQGLSEEAAKKKAAEVMATDEFKALIDSEIVARLVGERLLDEKFLNRYAQKDDKLIKKLGRFVKAIASAIKDKDPETSRIAVDIANKFDVAIQSAAEEKANSVDEILVSRWDKTDYDSETANIRQQINNATTKLNAMDVVYSGKISQKFGSKTEWKQWAVSELKKYGFHADREGFGDILFPDKSIYDAIDHLTSTEEIMSIVAIYRVLKRGVQIGEHSNHKTRQKQTVTFAAPIEINETRGNMAVVVNLKNNKYYVHRVFLPDGSKFMFTTKLDIKKMQTEKTYQGVHKVSLANTTRFASNTSIPQKSDLSIDLDKKDLKNSTISEVYDTVYTSRGKNTDIPDARALISDTKFSINRAESIAERTEKRNESEKKVDPKTLKSGLDKMKLMASLMKPYLEVEGILPTETIGKTAWKNGSYGRTMENTTLCVRTLTYEYFKDEVAKAIGRPLTVAESLLVSQKIYDIATYPQCIYCYVAADRKSFDAFIGEYVSDMDKYITRLKSGEDSKKLYEEYLHGRKATTAQEKRWAEWKRIAKSGEKYITASDISTRAKRNELINKGGKLANQVKDAQRYAQSASWAKTVSDYLAYDGDILKFSQKMVDMLNSEYGLRMYSFSDYTPAFIVENMQMVLDAAVRGLKVLSYTKDADYVRIFGSSGMAINMSCFAKYDSKTGQYVEDTRQGMKWDEVKELRQKYKNAGAVMVVTNDKMLDWALKQDWIDVVIPYHIVKTGTTIASAYEWRNYTRESADYASGKTATIYPTEHNNDFKTFQKLVEERGITPRFKEWYDQAVSGKISGDQYMKLVNEVRLPASKLSPVKPTFNFQAALDSFGIDAQGKAIEGGYVDNGGYMGNWFKSGTNVSQEVATVAEDIRQGNTVADVSYGRQSVRDAQKQVTTPIIDKRDLAPKTIKQENTELKRELSAEQKRTKQLREKLAKEEAKAARLEKARTYSKKEINDAIELIQSLTAEEIKSFANGYELKSMTGARRDQLISSIYIALHKESAEGNVGKGSVSVKILAATIADDIVKSSGIVDEHGKVLHLGDVYDAESIQKITESLTNEIFDQFANMGAETSNAKFQAEMRAVKEAFITEASASRAMDKFTREVTYQASKLKEMVEQQKRDMEDEGIQNVTKLLSSVTDAKGNIRIKKITEAIAAAQRFYTMEGGKLDSESKEIPDGASLTDFAHVIDGDLQFMIDEFQRLRKDRQDSVLSSDELRLLSKILAGMRSVINQFNKLYYNGRWVDIDESAGSTISDLHNYATKEKEYKNKVVKFLDQKIANPINQSYFYNILSPETTIEALEGYKKDGMLKALYHSIREHKQKAEHLAVQMKKPFAEYLDSREEDHIWVNDKGTKRTYRQKLNEKLINVNGYEITLGEAIYLYMLTKRENAHAGLMESGYITFDENNQRKLRFKILDIEATRSFILSQFDSADRAFLEMAENFFNKTSTEVKTKADMEIFGYTNIESGYYVPMIRDRYSRNAGVTDLRQSVGSIITVYNKSFNQNTVENAKALEGKNIMQIINDHADGLADYSELYLPLKSFDRFYNRRIMNNSGEVTSVREVLQNEVWNGTEKYLRKLFADIQGQGEAGTVLDDMVGKIRSGWVSSVLGLNLKVVATQTTSFVAANQVIEAKYLVPALQKFVGNQEELGKRADEYSDIIEARGFEMGSLKAQGNIDKVTEIGKKTGFAIEWMDRRVCLAIFHAAELKAEADGQGPVGSKSNAQAAAKIADEVIYTTQAMTGRAEKSALQRSKSEVAKTFSMFTSDSVKQLSHFYGNAMKYLAHKERAKTDATYESELEKDKKAVGRSAATLAMTGVMLGIITQAFKYLYAQEEEEPEDKIKDLATDVFSSTFNILPIVSDLADKFIFGYDMTLNAFDIANDAIEDTAGLISIASKSMGGEYVSNDEVGKKVINFVKTLGTVTGIPIAPVERTVTGLLRRFSPSLVYGYDAIFSNPAYTADLKNAVENGDERLAENILLQLYKNEISGAYTSEELSEVARLYQITDENGRHYDVLPHKIAEEINGVKLTRAQRKRFESIYTQASNKVNELIRSTEYQSLTDEQKAKAIKNIYALYYNRASAEVAGAEWTNAQAYSYLTDNYSALFASQAYKSGLVSYVDNSGREVSVKKQFVEYAQNLRLSEGDYLVIMYANGYRDDASRAQLISYINSLNLSDTVKAQIAARLGFEIQNGKVIDKEK